eukprot:1898221-Prymnesium_polylepis.1
MVVRAAAAAAAQCRWRLGREAAAVEAAAVAVVAAASAASAAAWARRRQFPNHTTARVPVHGSRTRLSAQLRSSIILASSTSTTICVLAMGAAGLDCIHAFHTRNSSCCRFDCRQS